MQSAQLKAAQSFEREDRSVRMGDEENSRYTKKKKIVS